MSYEGYHTTTERGGYISNDGFLWTSKDPDLELIEPPISVSCNYNYLQFTRNFNRPPEKREVLLVNHGDYPVAYKIQTTDNYSYSVETVYGVIPGRRLVVSSHTRMCNMAVIKVFHRPYSCYPDEEQCKYYNTPRKDKLFIQLAPYMCHTFSPAAVFHNERSYEKLRILLYYTGTVDNNKNSSRKQLLLTGVKGWCTWRRPQQQNETSCELKELKDLHMKMMDKFNKEAAAVNATSVGKKKESLKTKTLAEPTATTPGTKLDNDKMLAKKKLLKMKEAESDTHHSRTAVKKPDIKGTITNKTGKTNRASKEKPIDLPVESTQTTEK